MLKLLPDLKDCDILADKAYGTKEIRTYLHDQSARYTIPPKVNTKQPWPFDKETYKRRNVIERFFNRVKEFRRAETRYDKRDDSFLAFVMVARSVSLSAFCTSKRCFQIHPRIAAKSISSTSFKLQYYKSGAIKQPRLGIPSRGCRMSIKNPCQAAFRNRRPFALTDSSCDRRRSVSNSSSRPSSSRRRISS